MTEHLDAMWATRLSEARFQLARADLRRSRLRDRLAEQEAAALQALVANVASRQAGEREPKDFLEHQECQDVLRKLQGGLEDLCRLLQRYVDEDKGADCQRAQLREAAATNDHWRMREVMHQNDAYSEVLEAMAMLGGAIDDDFDLFERTFGERTFGECVQ